MPLIDVEEDTRLCTHCGGDRLMLRGVVPLPPWWCWWLPRWAIRLVGYRPQESWECTGCSWIWPEGKPRPYRG